MSIKIDLDNLKNDLTNLTRKAFKDDSLEIEITDNCEFVGNEPISDEKYFIEIMIENEESGGVYFEIEKIHQQYNFSNETMYGFFRIYASAIYDKLNIWKNIEEVGARWNR